MPASVVDKMQIKKINDTGLQYLYSAFYRPDFHTLFNETLGGLLVLTHTAESFKRSVELSEHSVELLKPSEKIKNSAESLKSSAACLYYNTPHAVPNQPR